GTHDRVVRVNHASGRTTVFERGIDDPWGLGYARDGTILLSSRSGLYRIRSGARPARIAAVNASPFAALPDGRIAYANETSVGLLARGRAHPLPVQVSIPHGLALLPDGTIAVSDTGNNRILRIGLSGETTVITARVSNALGLLAEPGGTLLTVEYGSGRLLRTDPAGTITVVARGLHKPYALTRAASGAGFVTEPTGTIRRILP